VRKEESQQLREGREGFTTGGPTKRTEVYGVKRHRRGNSPVFFAEV